MGMYKHTGVDLISEVGNKNVMAVNRGKVIKSINRMKDSEIVNQNSPVDKWAGNYIILEHGNGYTSRYSHLAYNSLRVKEGDIVNGGDVIAEMGESGYSTGIHLDFEVKKDNYFINPTNYALGNANLPNYETEKTIEELAYEVIAGKWGNGEERARRLIEAGYDYDAIQTKVNEMEDLTKIATDTISEIRTASFL